MMHGFGFGIGGFLGMILVWGLLIAGSIWLVKVLFSGGNNQPHQNNENNEQAIEILNKRYARGELNRDEFELMKKDLTIDS
ncbi:MAG: SHOCT domain-containing protein [Anaerolineales bacterium]|nr:SHOCT domain-containing protein [Anaerolineales bacterium]